MRRYGFLDERNDVQHDRLDTASFRQRDLSLVRVAGHVASGIPGG